MFYSGSWFRNATTKRRATNYESITSDDTEEILLQHTEYQSSGDSKFDPCGLLDFNGKHYPNNA